MYAYASGSPGTRVDPLGMDDKSLWERAAEAYYYAKRVGGLISGVDGAAKGLHALESAAFDAVFGAEDSDAKTFCRKSLHSINGSAGIADMQAAGTKALMDAGWGPIGAMGAVEATTDAVILTISWGVFKYEMSWRNTCGAAAADPPVPSPPKRPVTTPAPAEPAPPPISPQKQASHVRGTRAWKNRVKQGKSTSTWDDCVDPDALTQEAWKNGTEVPGRPGVKDYDAGRKVGTNSDGKPQTKVRVHQDKKGRIHGHPAGGSGGG